MNEDANELIFILERTKDFVEGHFCDDEDAVEQDLLKLNFAIDQVENGTIKDLYHLMAILVTVGNVKL